MSSQPPLPTSAGEQQSTGTYGSTVPHDASHASLLAWATHASSHAVSQQYESSAHTHASTLASPQPGMPDASQQLAVLSPAVPPVVMLPVVASPIVSVVAASLLDD